MWRPRLWALPICLLLLAFCLTTPVVASDHPVATHGTAVGEVRTDRAVIWSRTDREAYMYVRVLGPRRSGAAVLATRVGRDTDYTGKVIATGLLPGRRYDYEVWFTPTGSPLRGATVRGRFRTAPQAVSTEPVRLIWSGDLAGQNVCRDAEEGFPIFAAIRRDDPDLFIGLGDMIYADTTCEPIGRYGNVQIPGDFGPAVSLEGFRAHWRYSRADPGLSALLAQTSYYAVWDDHEVVNDFGPQSDVIADFPDRHLMPLGRRAFLDYNPIAEAAGQPTRLYRNVRWGRHLELFLLDTRQYRDPNLAPDRPDRSKTMLGREQFMWLEEQLAASDATWKLIVSSVPIAVPTGFPAENGRDGWANYDQDTGFEYELGRILRGLAERGDNALFVATDVHFAQVLRYAPFDHWPGFRLHEAMAGPLSAGLFPNPALDETWRPERLFFFGPERIGAVTDWTSAKRWLNYGVVDIDARGRLRLEIRNLDGVAVYGLDLRPQ